MILQSHSASPTNNHVMRLSLTDAANHLSLFSLKHVSAADWFSAVQISLLDCEISVIAISSTRAYHHHIALRFFVLRTQIQDSGHGWSRLLNHNHQRFSEIG
jgi:hypothetical protein